MKTKVLSLAVFFIMGSMSLLAVNKVEKFKVSGNCGSCEEKIETAAKSLDGVEKADWNKETKMMEVRFDESKTNVDDIQKAIAKVGYDTEKFKADASAYNALSSGCQYKADGKKKADCSSSCGGH